MAKQILTHTARNVEDLIALLKVGGFSCPTLPHYRYRPTQKARNALSKAGMIKQTGRCETSIQYAATDKFKEWQSEYETGVTRSMPMKWAKQKRKNNDPRRHQEG